MATSAPAKRYAKAVFDLALEQGVLRDVWEDLDSLDKLLHVSHDLVEVLTSPSLEVDRNELLTGLLEDQIADLTLNFILFLEEKARIDIIEEICHAFDDLYYDHQRIVKVTIVSAVGLDDGQLSKIEFALKAELRKEIESTVLIDPLLLGGFKLIIRDKVIDYSLLSHLNRIKHNIVHS